MRYSPLSSHCRQISTAWDKEHRIDFGTACPDDKSLSIDSSSFGSTFKPVAMYFSNPSWPDGQSFCHGRLLVEKKLIDSLEEPELFSFSSRRYSSKRRGASPVMRSPKRSSSIIAPRSSSPKRNRINFLLFDVQINTLHGHPAQQKSSKQRKYTSNATEK